jgi:hypothetical protein
MKISVDNPVIVIDRRLGQTSNTTLLHYDREDDQLKVGVWYWRVDQPNNRKQLMQWSIGVGLTKGDLPVVAVKPGEIYIYRIALLENLADGKEIAVVGVLKDGESDFGIGDKGINIGGTFADFHFYVRKKVRGFYSEYSHQIWSVNPQTQLLSFKPGTSIFKPLNMIADHNHHITIQPLYPGNIYYFVTLLVDEKGRWQYFKEIFITKQRQLNITLKNIAVRYNSESSTLADQTQFYHSFSVTSDEGISEKIDCLHTGDNYANNSTLPIIRPLFLYTKANSFFIRFLPKITFPFRAYTEDESVWCYTQAKEEDGFFDDYASSINLQQHDYLEFVTGFNETAVSPKSLKAINDDGDNRFEYDLIFEYYCDYI